MRGRKGQWALCSALALGCGDAPAAREGSTPTLTLLHTADLHSRAWPFRSRISSFEAELGLGEALTLSEVGGLARLATLLKAERQRGPTLWLDSGDALEGAEVFHRFGGTVELELLSGLGLAAMALGNHELSLGDQALGDLFARSASFPVLAANLEATADSGLWGRLAPSAIVQIAGVRVGVVGVANPKSPPHLASLDNPWRLELALELAATVQAAVDDLASRVALVVVLSHLGLEEDHALVSATSGIDLVLGGHQHVLTAEPEWQDDCNRELQQQRGCSPRRVPIVHSGAYARWLSRLELQLVPDAAAPSTLELAFLSLRQLPVSASVAASPEVEQYLEERRPPAAPPLAFLREALGRRSALGGDSALGNLTVDALQAATGADVALMNSSGLRADLEAGPLLRSDLALAFPFDEPWRLAWLSGRVLRRGLERGALRSAQRSCESALQVAGLELRIHCQACLARQRACLEVARPGPQGSVSLADDAWLLVVLPAYLTLPGGDLDEVGTTGTEVAGSAEAFLAGRLGASPRGGGDVEPCARAFGAWSTLRCREAFGALACPLTPARARAVCRALPVAEGARDGRIAMLP